MKQHGQKNLVRIEYCSKAEDVAHISRKKLLYLAVDLPLRSHKSRKIPLESGWFSTLSSDDCRKNQMIASCELARRRRRELDDAEFWPLSLNRCRFQFFAYLNHRPSRSLDLLEACVFDAHFSHRNRLLAASSARTKRTARRKGWKKSKPEWTHLRAFGRSCVLKILCTCCKKSCS